MKGCGIAFCLSVCVALVCACGGRARTRDSKPAAFEVPVPPAMMSSAEERAEYMVGNYWNKYSLDIDSLVFEQAFADWAALSLSVPHTVSEKSLLSIYEKDSLRVLPLARKYLYDPNSPYRDEDLFGVLAARVGGEEYLRLARLCSLNAVGTAAADFIFEDARGRRMRLSNVDAEYTLLLFGNPGCHACKEIAGYLGASELINSAIDAGFVKVLDIYIDEDLESWREHLSDYPRAWLCGFDPLLVIRDGGLYNIRAIPSLYLLDKDKTVILKDAPVEGLCAKLEMILAGSFYD